MQNTCLSSGFSLRCKGRPLSFSFNDYSCCWTDRFDRNPLLYSSSLLSLPCCCCCANSLYNKVPTITSASYLYGLRQSSLIQRSPSKKLIFNGLDRCNSSRFPVFDVDRSCYCEKDYIFKEKRVCGKEKVGKLGKGRFRRMVFEERREWHDLFDDSDVVDEVEIMLSLLTEDVGDECYSIKEGRGKSSREIEVVNGGNGGENNARRRKKNVESGVLESQSKFEYESKVVRSKEGEMRRNEDGRREKEKGVVLRRENVKVRTEEDERENLLRESSRERVRKEESENLLRENRREREEVEEREKLSRRGDHRQRARREGSSCSSYYSFSSGEFEIDNETQGELEENGGELSIGYMRDSKRSERLVSDEVQVEYQRHGDYAREQGVVLRKENSQVGFSGASSAVEYDWRKKSEKKLTDVSIDENKSSKESIQKQSRYRDVQESGYGKNAGSYSRFDDKSKQSTLAVNLNKETREQHKQTRESETRMKQFEEMSETHVADIETSSASRKDYQRDESSSRSRSSVRKESDQYIAAGQISREDQYRRNSSKLAEISKIQEMDTREKSINVRQSETRIKNQEDYSNMIPSSVNNRQKQHSQAAQASRLLDSSGKYQLLTQDVDSTSTSVSKRETDTRGEKQELNSSSIYKSHQELRDHTEMTTKQNTCISIVDYGNKRTAVVTEPPSQLVVSDSIYIEPANELAIEETADERLHSGTAFHKDILDRSQRLHHQSSLEARRDEAQGQPLEFISNEDALGSADRLQKSSAHYVGEFVQKVRNEISSCELHEVKKTHETEWVHKDEQQNKASLSYNSSKDSQSKEQDSRHLSQGSGTKGPSDEVWDVTEASIQEPPGAEAVENESTSGKAVVRRTGKSLWNIIGDIVRLRWASHSESHGSTAKSGRKSSPNQSTSSETWFSGNDPEENLDMDQKKGGIGSTQETTSVDQQQEEKISFQSQVEATSSSSSKGDMKQTEAGSLSSSIVLQRDSSLKRTSLLSGEVTSEMIFGDSFLETSAPESSVPLPSFQLRGSPVVGENSRAREAEGSGSGTIVGIDQPVPITLRENPRPAGKNEELKRRKLGRNDQVVKDRFDEWEEAYRLETDQRRVDEMFMREALLEAKKAADSWEVPVGAVLVRDGKIIARGYNLVEQLRDSTAHAEINCIREASNILRTWRLSETTLYVTLEPCPMCAGAILQARIDAVVWGAPNKLLGADGSWIRLFPNGEGGRSLESDKPPAPVHPFHPNIVVRRGVLAAECADTMQHFFQLRRREDKKPEPSTPPSRLPISHHPSRFMTKIHDAFHLMFCL